MLGFNGTVGGVLIVYILPGKPASSLGLFVRVFTVCIYKCVCIFVCAFERVFLRVSVCVYICVCMHVFV